MLFTRDLMVLSIFRELPSIGSLGGNQHGFGGEHEQQHFLQVLTGSLLKQHTVTCKWVWTMTWLKAISCALSLRPRTFCVNSQGASRKAVLCKSSEQKGRKQGRKTGFRGQIYGFMIVAEISFSTAGSVNVRSVCFWWFLLQVRVTGERCSADLYPPTQDGTLQGSTPRGCGQIWHGDPPSGRHGRQPQSARWGQREATAVSGE